MSPGSAIVELSPESGVAGPKVPSGWSSLTYRSNAPTPPGLLLEPKPSIRRAGGVPAARWSPCRVVFPAAADPAKLRAKARFD